MIKIVAVSGPPSPGKTSIIIKALENSGGLKEKTGVVKLDCLSSLNEELCRKNEVTERTGLAGNLCPDHCFVSNIEECLQWAVSNKYQFLITESAGPCNCCEPTPEKHFRGLCA